MDYLVRRLIKEIGADENDESKQAFLLKVAKFLEEASPPRPTPDATERIRSQRQAYKKRGQAAAPERNSAPLAALAQKERELAEHSTIAQKPTEFDEKRPDPDLAVYQVSRCLNPAVSGHQRTKILQDAVSLFASLQSKDPLESMADRLMLGLHSSAMACIERAAKTGNLRALDVNLRSMNKCAKTFLELARFKEERSLRREQKRRAKVDVAPDSAANSNRPNESIPLNGRASLHGARNASRKNGASNGTS